MHLIVGICLESFLFLLAMRRVGGCLWTMKILLTMTGNRGTLSFEFEINQ